MVKMCRRQVDHVHDSGTLRNRQHPMSDPTQLTTPSSPLFTCPGQFLPILGVQFTILHHPTPSLPPLTPTSKPLPSLRHDLPLSPTHDPGTPYRTLPAQSSPVPY